MARTPDVFEERNIWDVDGDEIVSLSECVVVRRRMRLEELMATAAE